MEELTPNNIEQSADISSKMPELKSIASRGDFPRAFDLLAMLLIIVLSQGVVSILGAALGLPMPEVLGGDVIDIENFIGAQVVRGESFAIVYPASMILAFSLLFVYIRLRDGKGRVARVSSAGFNPNMILGGLIWLISVQVVIEPISLYLPVSESVAGQGFWAIVTALFFAPIFEELIFRGLILESLLRRHRRLFSVIVSSLLFAIVHFQPSVVFSAFVSGLILGTIYLHTNSIFSTIILHSINNAIAFSLITLNVDDYSYRQLLGGGKLYYIVYAICFVISVIATVETWRRRKKK
ncbi:MAG: CPBP family intramembrane metalloprotease [Alistipes sp.]|nr:CPBP family intramembrane metalloprotease [Alistipes sp.]